MSSQENIVIKKDGTKEPWNSSKIDEAVEKAAKRAGVIMTEDNWADFANELVEHFDKLWLTLGVKTVDLHEGVIQCLRMAGLDKVADSYLEYRDYKTTYAKAFEDVKKEADAVLLLGDNENANFDSSLVSTKGSLIKGYLTKQLYQRFYLSPAERAATKRGDIYIHDLRDMIFGSFNCCLFDMATVLKDGFSMSNVTYTEPKSVLSALQVIGDITLVSTAQQFGGFTIPELDKTLIPYCHKSYDHYYNELQEDNPLKTQEFYHERAIAKVKRELEQGFQSLELKLNTVPCSRGDFAFTTITFGTWDCQMEDLDREFARMVGEAILSVRLKGHGGKQVVFPKLVFLFDEDKIETDRDHEILFDKAIKCSSKCMYPDYLSLSSAYGTVSKLYREHGVITSPMGCRAYLSPWKDPEIDKYITIGRSNIGAVSLNLPLIYKIAKVEGEDFFKALERNLQLTREFLLKRYDMLRHTKASTNPMCFTQGGLYKGFRKPEEEIGDLVEYMTASFGIAGLDDLTILHTGKGLKGNNDFAKEVVQFIYDKVQEYKKEDGYLYALYGTPAESLCGTQMKQFHAYCKSHGLEDEFGEREYYTNSFHLNVSEDVTPFEKQDEEFDLFHMVEGGHIQYVRMDNPENIGALYAVVHRGMNRGYYQGLNFDSAYCEDCGTHSTNVLGKCPKCGSDNLSVISRVCGYLGYSNINGKSRMNDAKMAEIKDRVSM